MNVIELLKVNGRNFNTNKIEIKGRRWKWTNHGWNEVICTRMHRGVEYEAMYQMYFLVKRGMKKSHIGKLRKSGSWGRKEIKNTWEKWRETQ